MNNDPRSPLAAWERRVSQARADSPAPRDPAELLRAAHAELGASRPPAVSSGGVLDAFAACFGRMDVAAAGLAGALVITVIAARLTRSELAAVADWLAFFGGAA